MELDINKNLPQELLENEDKEKAKMERVRKLLNIDKNGASLSSSRHTDDSWFSYKKVDLKERWQIRRGEKIRRRREKSKVDPPV